MCQGLRSPTKQGRHKVLVQPWRQRRQRRPVCQARGRRWMQGCASLQQPDTWCRRAPVRCNCRARLYRQHRASVVVRAAQQPPQLPPLQPALQPSADAACLCRHLLRLAGTLLLQGVRLLQNGAGEGRQGVRCSQRVHVPPTAVAVAEAAFYCHVAWRAAGRALAASSRAASQAAATLIPLQLQLEIPLGALPNPPPFLRALWRQPSPPAKPETDAAPPPPPAAPSAPAAPTFMGRWGVLRESGAD